MVSVSYYIAVMHAPYVTRVPSRHTMHLIYDTMRSRRASYVAHYAFLYVALPSLDDYDVKLPDIFRFMEDVITRQRFSFFIFVNLDTIFRIQLLKK